MEALGKEDGKVLRKTYSTVAQQVTGEEHTVGRLLNRSQKTVTSRYIDYSDDALHLGLVRRRRRSAGRS